MAIWSNADTNKIACTVSKRMMKNRLEKFGSFGAIVAAAACPICFPKLALIGALFGMGALSRFETVFFIGAQVLVVIALIGHNLSFKTHRDRRLLALAWLSSISLFLSLYVFGSEILNYAAFAGLIIATTWLILVNRRCKVCEAPDQQAEANSNP